MKRIFYFAIFVALVSSYTVSIGTCAKYAWDGRQCQKCIQNFHLFDGVCYSDIFNCVDYKSGISCQKCSNSTILVSNSCLDSQSLQKMLKSQNEKAQQFTVQNNFNTISKVVEFVERGFLRGNGGKLARFDVKEYNQVWRWFLLYQFDSQFTSYQRIIVDMDLKSSNFTAVDFSSLRNPEDFSTMFWRDFDNQSAVLSSFSDLYSPSASYLKISVRKAILSEVTQFQILTVSSDKVEIREICSCKAGNIILSEFVQNISSVVSSNSGSGSFHPFQLTFQGSQVDAQIDVNDGLSAAVTLVKDSSSWNHTLAQVIESGKALNLTQFTIIGQNTLTSFSAVVNYNPVNGSVVIVKLTLEALNQKATSTLIPSLPSTVQQPLSQQFNRNHTEEDGCITHTSFTPPFDGALKEMTEKLSKIKRDDSLSGIKQQLDPSTPFIQAPGLFVRRIVVSSFCQGYNYREVAYVEGDNASTTEYFTYYLEEEIDDVKTWYLLGNRTKNQTTSVYSNPTGFPVNFVDPSFIVYPSANLYSQRGIASQYLDNLSDDDRITFMGLTKNLTSETDRALGKMTRYSFNNQDANAQNYRATGWKVLSPPDMFTSFSPYMSLLCPQNLMTESIVIGSAGPKSSNKSQSGSSNGNNLVRN